MSKSSQKVRSTLILVSPVTEYIFEQFKKVASMKRSNLLRIRDRKVKKKKLQPNLEFQQYIVNRQSSWKNLEQAGVSWNKLEPPRTTYKNFKPTGMSWNYLGRDGTIKKLRKKNLRKALHVQYHPSKYINIESTLKQRSPSTFINVTSTLIFGWKWKLSRGTFIEVFKRWQNVVETMSTELRWFNVDDLTLLQRSYLVENEGWADACSSTLFQLRQNKIRKLLIELRCFNVDIVAYRIRYC